MARDPKAYLLDGRKRLLTIHDGALLTPALVRMLEGISTDAHERAERELDRLSSPTPFSKNRIRDIFYPVLVARSDGLAIYIDPEGGIG